MDATQLDPFPFSVVEDIFHRPLYTEETVRSLFKVVGEPPAAADKVAPAAFRLQELAKMFAFDLWHERRASASKRELRARRLATALLEVLTLAGQGEDTRNCPTIPGHLGPGALYAFAKLRGEQSGKDFVLATLQSVRLLRQDALNLADLERRRHASKPSRPGTRRQLALAKLIAGLSDLYFSVWEALPAVSRAKATNAAGGRFVRLLAHVAESLQNRGLIFAATPESLAKHWERLPADQKMRFNMDTIERRPS